MFAKRGLGLLMKIPRSVTPRQCRQQLPLFCLLLLSACALPFQDNKGASALPQMVSGDGTPIKHRIDQADAREVAAYRLSIPFRVQADLRRPLIDTTGSKPIVFKVGI